MPYYENVFIARQDISASAVEELAQRLSKVVDDNGGSITKTEHWGLKNLAYRIKKNRKGHYVLFNIDGPPEAIGELERTMRLDEDVLRYLTVRVNALEEGPSAMMERRDRREGRGGRGRRGGRGDDRPRERDDRPRERDKDREKEGA